MTLFLDFTLVLLFAKSSASFSRVDTRFNGEDMSMDEFFFSIDFLAFSFDFGN